MPFTPASLDETERRDGILAGAIERPPTGELRDRLFQEVERNFQTESSEGAGWAALKESTLRDRRGKGFGDGPTLQRTGDFRKAATEVSEADGDSAVVGFTDSHPFAEYHMEGTSRMDRRDPLAMGEDAIRRFDEAVIEHLEGHFG